MDQSDVIFIELDPWGWGLVSMLEAYLILSTFTKIWFRYCLAQTRKWAGALLCITCDIFEEVKFSWDMGKLLPEYCATKLLSVFYRAKHVVPLAIMIPAHTSIQNYSLTTGHGDFQMPTRVLWKLIIPLLCQPCFIGEENVWHSTWFSTVEIRKTLKLKLN
jgi:hypothetical protein